MTDASLPRRAGRRLLDALNGPARRAVIRQLAQLTEGQLTLRDAQQQWVLGPPSALAATVVVHDDAVYRRAAVGGRLALAEAYLDGGWDCDDLPTLLRIFARDAAAAGGVERGRVARIANSLRRLVRRRDDNTRRGSHRNIAAHYDLGNDFFRLWLDETMAYSSGVFPALSSSLREASIEKFDRVCRKLDLQASDQLVEIGGGWGGFAMHAAAEFGCHVTSTTISPAQYEFARQAIEDASLGGRVTLLKQDYRDLTGQFDKLVSIEMIEAVGHRRLDAYFRQCSRLLRPEGSMVIQAIVMPEQGYERYLKSVDFIQRHVFPGGCLPSLGSVLESVGRTTDLRVVHVEDFAPHYAETLRRWRASFLARLDEARGLGCTERFLRLWDFYLASCEAAFEERTIGLVQIQFDKPRCRRDRAELSPRAASVAPRPALQRPRRSMREAMPGPRASSPRR